MPGRYRSALVRVLVLTGFILAGCDSAGIVDVEPETEVSPFFAFGPAFGPYVERFVAEAEARGVAVDVSALTIAFTPAGDPMTLALMIETTLTEGGVYTGVAADEAGGGLPLQAFSLDDPL